MCNVGGIDRALRLIVGIFLISLYFIGDQIIGQNTVWGLVGIIPVATALFRFCPLYTILGVKTCTTDK